MRHGSLESGLGGFDYAAQMMGWKNIFHCEINPFCQTILKYYWPYAKSYSDIFEFSGTEWLGKVDIITAGFPCQPFSHAGKRKGSQDDRHLWPENMRIFREAKPPWIICENVPGLLTIESGLVFEQVCLDLEAEGYEIQTFIIPAVSKDAVHRRDRIWIVAHNNGAGCLQGNKENAVRSSEQLNSNHFQQINTHSNNNGLQGGRQQNGRETTGRQTSKSISFGLWNRGRNDPPKPTIRSVDDGFAGRLDIKTISKSRWRTESLKAYGNAIYWPIAYELFSAIESYENI
jgi:DNA (cytosine-5)-methyltransferase 1